MATGSLGSLVISLAVDTARFSGDLGRAAAITERRMKNIRETASRALGALTVAATAAGGALVAMVGRNLKAADDMRELAMAVGSTTQELSGLVQAATRSGLSQDQVVTGMKRLAANAYSAAKGVGEASSAFKAMGISVKREDGTIKSSGELIREMADSFSKAPDGITKTALAMAVFGKEGANWIPFLNEGSEKLGVLIKRLEALGVVISDKTARAADQFFENLQDLKDISGGFSAVLTAELAPNLASLSKHLTESANKTGGLRDLAEETADVMRGLAAGVIYVGTAFAATGRTIGAYIASLAALRKFNFTGAITIVKERFADIGNEFRAAAATVAALYDDTAAEVEAKAPQQAEAMTAPLKKAKEAVAELVAQIRGQYAQVGSLADDAIRQMQPLYQGSFSSTEPMSENVIAISEAMTEIRKETLAAGDAFKIVEGNAQSVAATLRDESLRQGFTALSDLIYGMGKGMDDFAKNAIDAFKRILANSITQQLFNMLGSLGGGGTAGGFLGFIGGLFSGFGGALAGGGPVSGGRSYLVGERGPEIFSPGSGGMITPNHAMAGGIKYAPTFSIHVDSRTDRAQVRQETYAIASEVTRRGFEQFRDHVSRGGR